jgi:hypothetical protein
MWGKEERGDPACGARWCLDRGSGEAARWGPGTVPGGAVRTGLNPIQISNESNYFETLQSLDDQKRTFPSSKNLKYNMVL